MHNAPKPKLEDLPSKAQLRRSSIIAAVMALFIGFAVYLPAEYGRDPTGIGSVLGLTEMGEIKQQLAKEAAEDELKHNADQSYNLLDNLFGLIVSPAHAQSSGEWRNEAIFTLEPGETHELKLTMKEGDVAEYKMVVEGGRVNFDLHAHGDGKSTTYEKGRGSTGSEGQLTAEFDGDHGWFWRNRDKTALTVNLRVRGTYSEFKKE